MSYVEQEHNCNRAIKHILLIGDDGISNQFIIQEINKSGYFSFERKCLQEINKSTKTISSDLVLISYLTLEKVIDIPGRDLT
ncbi:hypothetical protein J4H70_18985 [Vibrio alginolyticus]|uniref:hypothetical protein n=1 Tax=Vibrio alginolyticus TaxID=663 RepID=UPI001BD4686E|nr:hypothetical protein [Vibrio alginolyticus]MBS9810862.1 hypothetical protein [Vibrio alginolyticus]